MNNVIYIDLPTSVRGFARYNPDGTYTIVLNSRMSIEQQRRTWAHEMRHIIRGDFDKDDVDAIEVENHGEGIEKDGHKPP